MRTQLIVVLLMGVPCPGVACASGSLMAPAIPWGVFSLSSADGRDTTEIEISSVLITNATDARPETTWINEKTERVWVARKRAVRNGAPTGLQWTDSRTCYQLVETLATLIDLDQLADAANARIDDRSNAGTVYRIEGSGLAPVRGRSTAVRLADGRQVPAGLIVRIALDAWRPCWSDAPPRLTARP